MNEIFQSASRGRLLRSARPRRLLVAALAIGLIAAGCGTSEEKKPTSAVATTPAGLGKLARRMHRPIYWVGPAANVIYERTVAANGRVLIRYLPSGAKLGTSKPYLTVGTYALPDAYAATQRAASRADAVRLDVPGGAIAFSTKATPLNAWITYPGSRYQIEVFDPSPGRARRIVASNQLERVPGSPRESGRPVAVTAQRLSELAKAAARPVYWAGPQPRHTYELTQTNQGWFLIRYLPKGAIVGVPTPYLTVGTYPVTNALAAVKRLSLAKGAKLIKLDGGGLGVVDPKFPRSVYLAYPGSKYEIEVFDPSLARARRLVTSGQIIAVD
ncbi:MAG: hypothetical protein M3Q31_14685 [Actinomycetota bacterium]|nr:hypothetical protein [Actinomycetota bacterium]